MRILINYADKGCEKVFLKKQKKNCMTGLQHGFDMAIPYGPNDLDKEFCEKNKGILKHKRGAGYWIWKPYIILDRLRKLNSEDVLMYCDSGSHFIHDIEPLFNQFKEYGKPVMTFGNRYVEKVWTKRDLFMLLDCDNPEFTDSKQRHAGFVITKKTDLSLKFFKEWLSLIQKPHLVTDTPSENPNYRGFREHRHDQSILSLLAKKYNFEPFKSTSQEVRFSPELPGNYPMTIKRTWRK